VPVAGEPVMYGFGPELPAEATTMTPSLAALVEATADGSSALPNDEPSDMLITSMSWSTAHSMPSTVTSVEPAQPKTRPAYRSALGPTPGPTSQLCELIVEPLYGPVYLLPSASTPKPTAVPATWVPWPKQSSGFGSGCGIGWKLALVGSAL